MIDIEKMKKCEHAGSPILKEWEHCGFKCVVLFVRSAHKNGYVRIPKGHPTFEVKNYDELPISVHGGLTFCSAKLHNIREDTDFIWYGFDTVHCDDRAEWDSEDKGHLWTTEEVVKETEHMAEQFKTLTWKDIVLHKLAYMPDWFKERVIYKGD